jgi:ribosomal-protein-alanine N-acetyltransferase
MIPVLTTSRLILRPFTAQDADPLYRILAEKDMLKFFPGTNSPSIEGAQRLIQAQLDHWAKHDYGWWAVALRADPEQTVLGWNGLQYLPDTDEIEIGFLLNKDHWGQGLTTEAAQAGLQFGFETLNLPQIMAVAHPENRASRRVLEKLGMAGTGRADYFGMKVSRYELISANPSDKSAPDIM